MLLSVSEVLNVVFFVSWEELSLDILCERSVFRDMVDMSIGVFGFVMFIFMSLLIGRVFLEVGRIFIMV